MPDYKKMYYELFDATTRAIEILQKGQSRCEELYIQAGNELDIVTSTPQTPMAQENGAQKEKKRTAAG